VGENAEEGVRRKEGRSLAREAGFSLIYATTADRKSAAGDLDPRVRGQTGLLWV
jgi:hypothetical protein